MCTASLFSQEETASPQAETTQEEETAPEEATGPSPVELDIRTSTLTELADWCRILGLSEAGGKGELASRLREHYKLEAPSAGEATEEGKTVVIESASSSEYFTLSVVDEEYARLKGDVKVSLKDKDDVHTITAQEILYNRTRNTITAKGNVVYTHVDGGTTETFRGQNIQVNLDTWATVFVDALSERSSSGASPYRFSGTLISKDDEDITVIEDADISRLNAEGDSYWSLSASKVWLLSGSDWALLNASIKVGEIPVFYLPAFIFPADELIFHPVIGTKTREGSYIQTTTYILGAPPASTATESSIISIMGQGSSGPKKIDGLFWRDAGEEKVETSPVTLTLMGDAYTRLGYYVGLDWAQPSKGAFTGLDLSLGLGFSKNIYTAGAENAASQSLGSYTNSGADGKVTWNKSTFLWTELPFRYKLVTTGGFNFTGGNFKWSLPIYSDPYIVSDFGTRKTSQNIVDLIMSLVKNEIEEPSTTSDSGISNQSWELSGSYTPSLSVLSPYVQSLSFSSISSSIMLNQKANANAGVGGTVSSVDPNRNFFYPNSWKIFSLSSALSGTPLNIGSVSTPVVQQRDVKKEEEGFNTALGNIGLPLPPWEISTTEEEAEEAGENTSGELLPPTLAQNWTIAKTVGMPNFTIGYNVSSSATFNMNFNKNNWNTPEDIKMQDMETIASNVLLNGSLNFAFKEPNTGLYSSNLVVSGKSAWNNYLYTNNEAPANSFLNEKRSAYSSTVFSSNAAFTNAIKPFAGNEIFGDSTLGYNITSLIAKTVFDSAAFTTEDDTPKWDWVFPEWNATDISVHNISFNGNAKLFNQAQTFSLSYYLPPQTETIQMNAGFKYGIGQTTFSEKITEPFDEELRVFDIISIGRTWTFATNYSLSSTLRVDPMTSKMSSFDNTLRLGKFLASLSAANTTSYTPAEGVGWQAGETKFQWRTIGLSWADTFSFSNIFDRVGDTFSFNVSTALNFDPIRYTNSNFKFSFGLTLKMTNFMDLSINMSSENNVIFRYYQGLTDFPFELPGEKNVFIDLFKSFAFWDTAARKASGFKFKSFSLNMTHYMGDWNFTGSVTLSPYVDGMSYKFNTLINFAVTWIPIPDLKVTGQYEQKTDFLQLE
ncbi:MAG: hypothetical protein LBM77_14305 [Spirochaetaceae bacterium]|nr:hypothetical protein [Spirochaetaceae bacterium]